MPAVFGNSTHSIASTYTARYQSQTACGLICAVMPNMPVTIRRWIWCEYPFASVCPMHWRMQFIFVSPVQYHAGRAF